MRAKIVHWPGYFGKWEIFHVEENAPKGSREVEINGNLLIEYLKTVKRFRELTAKIWDEYNKDLK
jgi:hypothetical protein